MFWRRKFVVIPTQVSPPIISPRKKERIVLGSLTRLIEPKGIGEMIDAMSLLPSDVELQIGGTGFDKATFVQQAKQYRDRVRFLGYVDDTAEFYAGIDIALLPSESEGNSLFVLEAALAGLPLVLTPVGNAPYFLEHMKSCIFVDRDPEEISSAVGYLLDRNRRKAMGDAARHAASVYGYPLEMAKQFYTLLEEQLKGDEAT
jgi:UDP-glucose:(heptosyl)LPS alpha-1,3-glucosyltransferase